MVVAGCRFQVQQVVPAIGKQAEETDIYGVIWTQKDGRIGSQPQALGVGRGCRPWVYNMYGGVGGWVYVYGWARRRQIQILRRVAVLVQSVGHAVQSDPASEEEPRMNAKQRLFIRRL